MTGTGGPVMLKAVNIERCFRMFSGTYDHLEES
jgi:hypothetical protein